MKNFTVSIVFLLAICFNSFSQENQTTPKTSIRNNLGKTEPKVKRTEINEEKNKRNKDYRICIGGGYAYKIGKIEKTNNKDIDDFMKGLRHGFGLDFHIQRFFDEYWGLGIFCTHAKQNHKKYFLSETIKNTYLGSEFVTRIQNEKAALYIGFGLGAIFYNDKASAYGSSAKISATSFGTSLYVAGETRLDEHSAIGIKLAVTGGHKKIENNEINLSNLLLTCFYSFRTR